MIAGSAKIDITPIENVWMAGMLRAHQSEAVHDHLYARALVLSDTEDMSGAYALVSVDVCFLNEKVTEKARSLIESKTGIPAGHTVIAATHTHSGPSTDESGQLAEESYLRELVDKVVNAAEQAASKAKPAMVGTGHGSENTISHYRRFISDDGKIVMIWEQNPDECPMRCLGKIDPAVGVLRVADADNPEQTIAVLFNHAGHPNVMSGDNYLISADYPGITVEQVEAHCGCNAMFMNGAQGTVDIDNWRYRDWDGMVHIGKTLADEVNGVLDGISVSAETVRGARIEYTLPPRMLSDEELAWADRILAETGGAFECVADGVGDDFKAVFYRKLYEKQSVNVDVEQICIAMGDTAFISFPGELFTEIGMRIKEQSPFAHTYILGLANGYIGYVPTRDAVEQGGYEVDTRCVGDDAEDIIVEHSLKLLDMVRHESRR